MGNSKDAPVCAHGKNVLTCNECAEVPDIALMRKLYWEAFQTSRSHHGAYQSLKARCERLEKLLRDVRYVVTRGPLPDRIDAALADEKETTHGT